MWNEIIKNPATSDNNFAPRMTFINNAQNTIKIWKKLFEIRYFLIMEK